MVYTLVNDIVHLNLNSIFNILNAITTKYRCLAYKNKKNLVFVLRMFSHVGRFSCCTTCFMFLLRLALADKKTKQSRWAALLQ